MGSGKVPVTILFTVFLIIGLSISGCLETSVPDTTANPVNATENLTAHFLDVGQGDSILLQFAGKNVLIDAGETDMGNRVVDYLKAHGVSKLDLVIATHPHSDHIGGLAAILNAFPAMQILDSGQVYSSQTFEDFLTLVDQRNIPYKVAERGQKINIDPRLIIKVLNPPAQRFDDINDNSVALKVTFGQVSFLLMGDAERDAETSMLSSDLDSDILKVGHHGSRSSSSPAFLETVSPEVSVIEVGTGNDYGHPAPETLNALDDAGSAIYRTDLAGNIDITTDGWSYYISTENTASGPSAAISITRVQFDAPGDDRQNLNGEWIQITNSGQTSADMTGWQLYDESGQVYAFPRFSLSPDASVKVFSGKGLNGATELYIGRGSPVWNNSGDTAILKDTGGNTISQRSV